MAATQSPSQLSCVCRSAIRAFLYCLGLAVSGIFVCQAAPAQSNSKNIMVVYSFADRKEFSAIDDLKSGLRAVIPWTINFYVENLEGRRFDDKDYEQRLADSLKNTYGSLKLDLVIADNFPALNFLLRHRNELFPETPIVFFDLDEAWLAAQKLPPNVTGVTAPVDIEATINLALQLHASAGTVAVVINNSPYERYWLARIRSEISRHRSRLNEVDMVGLAAGELMQQINQLPPNSFVLFQLNYQETEQPAIGAHELAEWIGRRFPTYSILPWNCIFHGCIGGDSFDGYRQIALVAQVAKRVLSGERPESVPVVRDSVHHIVVNWRTVAEWHIPESALPPGTEFRLREPPVWERYRGYILAAIAVIIAQALLIAALLWQRARKRKAEAVLRESEERFRLLANTTPSLIWMCDPQGKVTYLNDRWATLTGPGSHRGYGDSWTSFVHPDDLPGLRQRLGRALAARQSFSKEYRLRAADGTYRWMFDVVTPRTDTQGHFAGLIGSSLDITDQRLAREALKRISGQLIEAQEKERARIARELHDDVCQRLAFLSVQLEHAHRNPDRSRNILEDVRMQCSEIADDVQALSHRLHSSKLEYLGIVAALRSFADEFSRQNDVEIEFTHSNVPKDLPKDIALCLFRIAQEAVHNAMKYSQTTRFSIDLSATEAEIRVEVRDRGTGFDVQEAKRSHGLGLASMRERVDLVRGKFCIESRPGEGTRIIAAVPVPAASEEIEPADTNETTVNMGNG